MPFLNKVFLMGHLTRDPETSSTPSGTLVSKFGIAYNRKIGEGDNRREEVVFVDITAWARTAEIVQQYVHKGDPLFIEGRLSFDTWEDKNGGGKRSRLYVTAENVQLLGGKRDGAPGPNGQLHPATRYDPAVNDGIPF